MNAYKGTYNGKCLGMEYKVGETYTHDGVLKMCEAGFHFCQQPDDVLSYYPFTKNFRMLEIQILGDVGHKDNKSVTNKFTVLRELPLNQIPFKNFTFDANNNLVKRTDAHGKVIAFDLDASGNVTHFKKANGYECWLEYNHLGNVTCRINNEGRKTNYLYNVHGDVIKSVESKVVIPDLFNVRLLTRFFQFPRMFRLKFA